MLTAVVISPDGSMSEGLKRLAIASRQVSIDKVLDGYPGSYELVRIWNTCDPDFLLLDVSNWKAAAAIVGQVNANFPKTSIVGVGPAWVRDRQAAFQASGVSVLLTTPLELKDFQQGILAAFRATRCDIRENLVAFLPAKAGNGSSVTAFNVAGALAGELKKKVLLLDGDLHSGVVAVRASFTPQRSLPEILDKPEDLTRDDWLNYVVERHSIDILAAGRSRVTAVPRWSNYYHLLQSATKAYETVVADLPEVVNDATAEVVLRAGRVHVVTTVERPALELALRRCEDLSDLGVAAERLSLVINRLHPTDIRPAEVADLLGYRVAHALPNDYQSLRTATDKGLLVSRDTRLGRSYLEFARKIAGLGAAAPRAEGESRRRFRLGSLIGR